MTEYSLRHYKSLLLLSDALAALAALWLTFLLYTPWLPIAGALPPLTLFCAMASMLLGIWSMRGYHLQRIFRIADEVAILIFGGLVGVAIFASFLFFVGQDVPRLLVLCYAFSMPGVALVLRLGLRVLLKSRKAPRVPTERVLIVGAGDLGQQVATLLRERAWLGLELIGFVDDHQEAPLTLGTVAEIERLCLEERIDVVILTLPLEEHARLSTLLERIHMLPVQVKLLPNLYPLAYLNSQLEMFGGMPLIGLSAPVISPWQAAVKRAMDVIISLLGLLLTLPLLILIAIGVRLTSSGSIIFKQERVGEGGKLFAMYKFRTMVENAEQMLLEQAKYDPEALVKKENDPRVTPFGQWLRRFSLDELPQLWNVLRGDMSIVGPRPEIPYLVERYEPWQRKRLLVPQGITGWWQINGRSDKPMLYHTEDDLYYIRNYSLLLDLEILWKTIWVVLRGKGAY